MNEKIKSEKKAEVPIVILVLGVLLLCVMIAVAWFSSSFLNNADLGNSNDLGQVEACLSYRDQYKFYENIGYSKTEIIELPVFKGKITSDNFLICNSEGIKIKYPLN